MASAMAVVGAITDIVLPVGVPAMLNKLDEKESGKNTMVTYVNKRTSAAERVLRRASWSCL